MDFVLELEITIRHWNVSCECWFQRHECGS